MREIHGILKLKLRAPKHYKTEFRYWFKYNDEDKMI